MKYPIIAIIAARMTSTRLPGKVMLPLSGKPVLEHLVDRVKEAELFSKIVIATSSDPKNAAIVETAEHCCVGCYQGDEEDVLSRFVYIMRKSKAENCVRFCADNPLTDMETTSKMIELHLEHRLDYTCVKGLQLQLGLTEVLSRRAIEVSYAEGKDPQYRQHITLFVRENAERFKIMTIKPDPLIHQAPFRLTLDYAEDYELLQIVFNRLYDGKAIKFRRVLEFLRDNPEVASINSAKKQTAANVYWEALDANMP